jgi:Tol biopolymer transport system component
MAAVLAVLLAASAASAAAPEGPRLAFVKLGFEPPRLELVTVNPAGTFPQRLAGGGIRRRPLPYPYSGPTWSPDGSQIVSAYSGSLNRERPRLALFIAAADGSGLREIPGTVGALSPIFSPDGHTIAFARQRVRIRRNGRGRTKTTYESASIWLIDLAGGKPRRVTPWRDRLAQIPSSFSPDGKTLAITRLVGDQAPEAIGLTFDGSASTVLARNALEPVYSPDGATIAILRGPQNAKQDRVSAIRTTDIYTIGSGGGSLRRLTATPRLVELAPQWDPSGERIAYAAIAPPGRSDSFLGLGGTIMEINTDGTCRNEVLSFPQGIVIGATWQPGPGREAGRISC